MTLGKRAFDLVAAIAGLVVLAPLFVAIALLIKWDDGGSVFFRQVRIGRHGLPFRMWKFRTMVVDAERRGPSPTIGRDPRVTWIGEWLRRSKLDELPQLFNVVMGDMSLVGPRPEVPHYVALYDAEERKILDLAPGLIHAAWLVIPNESELLEKAENPERYYVEEAR